MTFDKNITPKNFHASDLYSRWKALLKKSKISIRIFTPYLDQTINKLLKGINPDEISITIITCLEGDNLFQRGYQLEALKESIENGAQVLNISGLHAKVLFVDDEFISLGSQNFTNRGRKNKETGFISKASFIGSDFIESLYEWENEATEVSIEMLNDLIDLIEKNQEDILKIKNDFEKGVNQIIEDHTPTQELSFSNDFEYFYSINRSAQEEVILTMTQPPSDNGYISFFAGDDNNLCKWIKTNGSGKGKVIELIDYDYYPAINLRTQQMSFLRIHTSRITFTKNYFYDPSGDLKIKNSPFDIEFTFLKSNTKKANIKIVLTNTKMEKANLYFHFNLEEFKLIKSKYSNENLKEFITANLINKPRKLNSFLLDQIEHYKFETSKTHPKEIEKFLPKYHYKVRMLEFKKSQILLFEEL